MNLANSITLSRIAITPLIGYSVLTSSYTLGLGLTVVAGLDGHVARRFDQKTALGSVLDPLADKLLVSTLAVTLLAKGLLPVPVGCLIIARDVLLTAATVRLNSKSANIFRILSQPLTVNPPLISKVNTFLQLSLLSSTLAAAAFGFVDSLFILSLNASVCITTCWSGWWYYKNFRHKI